MRAATGWVPGGVEVGWDGGGTSGFVCRYINLIVHYVFGHEWCQFLLSGTDRKFRLCGPRM